MILLKITTPEGFTIDRGMLWLDCYYQWFTKKEKERLFDEAMAYLKPICQELNCIGNLVIIARGIEFWDNQKEEK